MVFNEWERRDQIAVKEVGLFDDLGCGWQEDVSVWFGGVLLVVLVLDLEVFVDRVERNLRQLTFLWSNSHTSIDCDWQRLSCLYILPWWLIGFCFLLLNLVTNKVVFLYPVELKGGSGGYSLLGIKDNLCFHVIGDLWVVEAKHFVWKLNVFTSLHLLHESLFIIVHKWCMSHQHVV